MGFNGKRGGAVVGVDIGSSLIKVVEAKPGKTGIHLTGLAIAPTPAGVIENGVIVDPAGLGAAIKKLLSESGIKSKQCISAVSGQSSVVLRVIEVPKMTRDELGETMKWEVERHVPFAPTEVVMDFQPLERPSQAPDAQNMEVFLAVAQQDMINRHVETIMAAGLKPVAIDVEPLAAGRSLIEMTEDVASQQTVAILDIGDVNTNLDIFEAGLLTFPNPPLPVAGINITRAISDDLGESVEQAERLKKELARIDLERAASAAPGLDIEAAEAEPDAVFCQETIGLNSDSPFDIGAPDVQPEEEKPETIGAAFDLSPWASSPEAEKGFTDTIDGPMFDLGGDGIPQEPVTPVFDLPDEAEPFVQEPAEQVEMTEQMGAEPADSGDLKSRVGDAVAPVLLDLVTELRRSLDYYRTRYQNQPQMIFLSGGTARIPNLDKYLASELGIPVEVADPVGNLTVATSRYSAQYLSEVSALFSVSIGLAIRDMLS